MSDVRTGDGWAVSSLDGLGEGPGFRKIRAELAVTAFGVNGIVLPAGYSTDFHWHERQEELYFVHSGTIEIELADGEKHVLEAGGIARVDGPVPRRLRNVGEGDAVYVCVGGLDGYVGRDAHLAGDEEEALGGFGK
jgi:mannose-6-phosphate isomerase-like protein (cupin superfamily)